MSHLINEIELDESRFKGKSILNIVENMKHECIEQVVSNFCLLWHADKDDVMYAATHYRNGIIPNESAIKASINYPEYKIQWNTLYLNSSTMLSFLQSLGVRWMTRLSL